MSLDCMRFNILIIKNILFNNTFLFYYFKLQIIVCDKTNILCCCLVIHVNRQFFWLFLENTYYYYIMWHVPFVVRDFHCNRIDETSVFWAHRTSVQSRLEQVLQTISKSTSRNKQHFLGFLLFLSRVTTQNKGEVWGKRAANRLVRRNTVSGVRKESPIVATMWWTFGDFAVKSPEYEVVR